MKISRFVFSLLTLLVCALSVTVITSCDDHNHELCQWKVEIDATCFSNGSEIRFCANCEYMERRTIQKKEHIEGEPTFYCVEEGSCTEDGLYHVLTSCSMCGTPISEEYVVNKATGHQYGEWTDIQAVSCTEHGLKNRSCKCGFEETTQVDAKGHVIVDGECTACDKKESEGLEFTVSADETYCIVSGIGSCTDTDLVIPAYHNALPVKEIGEEAFSDCAWLRYVTLADTVTQIKRKAFSGCVGLEGIKLSENLINIGNYAFLNCRRLTTISIPDSVVSIAGIYEDSFADCNALAKVTLGKGLQSTSNFSNAKVIYNFSTVTEDNFSSKSVVYTDANIESGIFVKDGFVYYDMPEALDPYGAHVYIISYIGYETNVVIPNKANGNDIYIERYAFWKNKTLETVTLSDGIKSLSFDAFYGCDSLKKINVGADVNYIYTGSSLTALTEINVDERNVYFNSIDGVLYSEDGKTLLKYPAGKEDDFFTVPSGVDQIGDNAFSDNKYIRSIELHEGVKAIGYYAFSGCGKLESVNIPNGIKRIEDQTFYECFSIKAIDLPESLEYIGRQAFADCKSIESISIPDSVTEIMHSAFYSCTNLKEIKLSNNLKRLSQSVFLGCKDLVRITIPDSVEEIGYLAFSNCSNLSSVVLGKNLKSISDSAFNCCYSLVEVYDLSDAKISESEETQEGHICHYVMFYNYSLDVPSRVWLDDDGLVYVNVEMLSGDKRTAIVAYIGDEVDLVIPNGAYAIYKNAFSGNSDVRSVTIASSIHEIQPNAFYGSGVTSVTFKETFGWEWFYEGDKSFSADLEDPEQNAQNLRSTYVGYALIW